MALLSEPHPLLSYLQEDAHTKQPKHNAEALLLLLVMLFGRETSHKGGEAGERGPGSGASWCVDSARALCGDDCV